MKVLDATVDRAIDALGWVEVHGVDAVVAAVGRELDAPVVSADSDLTHEVTKHVVDVEEYRD